MPKLNIATFNIDKDSGKFPERIHHLSNIIYKNRFDVLCLQEDFDSNRFSSGKFLNIELDYNYITTKTRQKVRNGVESSSNLTILSKYPIELLEEIYFNKTKDEERACQIVKIKYNDYDFVLINTHLCHLSSKNRVEQINTILDCSKKHKYDIKFLCGDLNVLPNYAEAQMIRDFGFIDDNKEFTHEDKVTLDYIFHKTKLKLSTESKILLKGFSDHHCLLNSFKI